MTRQERAQRVAEKLGLKIEGFTPGPWKAGYWSGVCRIPEHNGNHPGPPECKYEPEFNEMRSDEFGSGFVGIAAEQPGVDVVSTSYGSLKILPADAHLIAAAPTLWNHLLDLEEEVERLERSQESLNNKLYAASTEVHMGIRQLEEYRNTNSDLRTALEFERNSTNCDKLFRERQTKRHWQERAEKAEAAPMLRSELEDKKS